MKSYSREEVVKATLAYFNGDELAADVWARKYCLKDSEQYYELTPTDMHWRIAKELARIEAKYPNPLTEEEIFETLDKFERIVPQGSPMSGIGNNLQVVSLSNCFVIGNKNESDSYGGIMKIDQEQVQLMKRRGGVGHDLSHIRPKGSVVKNSALTSTGIVPFMERYSNTTKEVAQDGRRGALMLSVAIKHPDSEEFIDAKLEQGKVTGANISVKIDDEFMNAVLNNIDYTQQYPIVSENPSMIKTVSSSRIWKKIVHNAWKSAEPGILYWDTIIRESIPDCYADFGYKTVSTNPCVSEDTLILTDKGYEPIGELVGIKVNVWNGKEFSKVVPAVTGENQKMLKLTFSDGCELKCTPYHGFYTWEGFDRDGKSIKVEAKDLKIGDKLEKYEFPILERSNGINVGGFRDSLNVAKLIESNGNDISKPYYTLGFFAGDGTLKSGKPYIQLYGEKRNLINNFIISGEVSENSDVDRTSFLTTLPYCGCDFKKFVPNMIEFSGEKMSYIDTLSWLGGLIDSDGSRNSEEGSVSISSTDRNFLMNIKLHVLNTLGVNGSVIDEKEGGLKEIKGIEYNTNKSYRLIISAFNVNKLVGLGLKTYRVETNNINVDRDSSRFIKVTSIEEIEDAEKVYCFTEEKRGRGCFGGVVTAQCGEIPLCPYDSCRLLVLNLYGYVKNPFTKDAYFDWVLFKADARKAMRYMDDIIDLEQEKIDAILAKINSDPEDEFVKLYEKNLWERIKEMTESGRRTGLGITAEGDMLAALGFIYGTDAATDFSDEVHKQYKLAAYRSSVEMAKERGAFPIYDSEREVNNPFIQRIKDEDEDLYNDMVEYGRRNIALLTIAPTGTASIMTQTTSGIECVFMPVYRRRRKINTQEKNIRVDFVDDEGVAWTEYAVFHHKFADWLVINGYDVNVVKTMTMAQVDEIVKKSPYYKATSNDVDWVKKVEMQGRIQKHVDHSISVTTNLPADATEEIVAAVYEAGWKHGCKGMTIYRDGSRNGVLITNNEKKEVALTEKFQDTHAPKRPKRLKGDIIRFQNNNEKWIGVVGLIDGRPYEIFTGLLSNGLSNIPPYVKECEIIKNIIEVEELDPDTKEMVKVKKKRYDIEYFDAEGKKQSATGLSHKFNPEFWNYAKLISGILRHGMPLVYTYELIDSLNLNSDSLNTWKNGIVRIIKKYIKNGEKVKGKCPNCGSSDHLEFVEGCLVCKSCGNGVCG